MTLFTDTVSFGEFDLAVSSNGESVVKISRGRAERSYPDALTDLAIRELGEYFCGHRKSFTFPISLEAVQGSTPFRRRVWSALATVPYGESISYGELANMIGCHGGARAVGGAVGANELLIAVPCHRVITTGGSIGGFSAGLDMKTALLEIEGIRIKTGIL